MTGTNSGPWVHCAQCDEYYSVGPLRFLDSRGREIGTFDTLELKIKRPRQWPWRKASGADQVVAPSNRRKARELVATDAHPYCPENHRLPYNLSDSMVVAVIGEVGSGKSHYLAALARLTEQSGLLGGRYDVSILPGTGAQDLRDDASNIFEKREVLEPTTGVRGPYFYELSKIGDDPARAQSTIASFYDVPGETLRTPSRQAADAAYAIRAGIYILLLDPTCIPELGLSHFRRPESPMVSREIVDSLAMLQRRLAFTRRGDLRAPFVITIAKADLLEWSDPARKHISAELLRCLENNENPSPQRVKAEVRSLLRATSAESVVRAAENRFGKRNVMYSLVSAIGEPSDDNRLTNPRSLLVAHPLLQAMRQLGWK